MSRVTDIGVWSEMAWISALEIIGTILSVQKNLVDSGENVVRSRVECKFPVSWVGESSDIDKVKGVLCRCEIG